MSMKPALEQPGVGRCYYMADLSRLPLRLGAADRGPDSEARSAGFTATVDYPG
jgi:hypothetical protein